MKEHVLTEAENEVKRSIKDKFIFGKYHINVKNIVESEGDYTLPSS